jgi:hypothetical protein
MESDTPDTLSLNSNNLVKTAQKGIVNPSITNLQTHKTIYHGGLAVKKIRVVPITMKALTL